MNVKLLSTLASLCLVAVTTASYAGSKWVRLSWEGNASTEAIVSFTPSGSNNNPYVSYGYSTSEGSWSSASLTFTTNMASITSKHVRLTGLTPDSAVYFRVCDNSGCGQRFWFRTAPNDNSPFTVVAGGDTRTGWTNRQNGNRLVAKIRPLFVMHGGDFTNSNNNSEWSQWLTDWELTYSSDTINGVAYKRIYPIIGTHGNHEDNDISTICKMLGVDSNRNNSCSANDTYYSVNVSPLLRVYTLNSQFQGQSSSLQNAQNNWLASDLSSYGGTATWRFAQYHKPMFPHYTGKSENPTLFNWWAQLFYDNAMNVVVESDTHMNKLTEVVVPNGNTFATASSGTVYVGEGSWGAPARSANDPKSWTIDLASIQQFKVITVSSDGLDLRTAQFDSSASTLSKAARDADPTALPNNVNWWYANGEVYTLEQDGAMRTVRAGSSGGGGNNGTTATFSATDDTFISSNNGNSNYDGSSDQLLADGADSAYGEMQALIKWNPSSIPTCATVESAKIEISVFNPSSGAYNLYEGVNGWSESNATWNSVGGFGQQGTQVGSFTPTSNGVKSIQLNAAGTAAVQSWIGGGSNNGVIIASGGTNNGIDFNDRENGPAPKLVVTYNQDSCGGGGGGGSTSTETQVEASDDTFISSNNGNSNYDNSNEQLLADGADSAYGQMQALIKWDTSAVPSCATVEEASVSVNIFNPSGGTYNLYAGVNNWNEGNATWNSVGGTSQQGSQVGSFNPSSNGLKTITLNSTGISTVQSWITGGGNRGIVIASGGTTNGIDFNDRENGPAPTLNITWNDSSCGGGGGPSNQAPIADFDTSISYLEVDFSDASSDSDGSIFSWSWNFGDGSSSSQENPSHSYGSAGTYSVSLTVTDNDGATDSISRAVSVSAPPTSSSNNQLLVNEQLNSNGYLESANGNFRFYLQGDGNLVLRDWRTRKALWASATSGRNGTRLVLQSDGNLVLYTSSNSAVWASGTVGSGADRLTLTDNGMLALYRGSTVVWSQNASDNSGGSDPVSAAGTSQMTANQVLRNNEYLVSSNGAYRLYLQGDGNLVLRDWQTRAALWASGTHGQNATELLLRSDGNLVLNSSADSVVWSSGTGGSGADRLALNDDGSLALYQGNSIVWSQNGGSNSGGGSGGGSGGTITHVGTSQIWDGNGLGVRVNKPSGTRSGDLMVLVLHRTDSYLPLQVSGWTRAAECFKRDNGYDCVGYNDCTSWRDSRFCETFGDYGRAGRDLAQAVYYKRAGSNEPNSYSFDLDPGSGGAPGWAILTTLRGASTSNPIRDTANEGCDNNNDSVFPSVYGQAGDMVLLSQSFDDAIAQDKFRAPNGTTTFGYVSNSDEAGFLYGGVLDSTGETGTMKTNGDGASACKDALVSITIKPE